MYHCKKSSRKKGEFDKTVFVKMNSLVRNMYKTSKIKN